MTTGLGAAVILGLITGLGLVLIMMGLRRDIRLFGGRPLDFLPAAVREDVADRFWLRLGLAVGAAVVVGVLTLWPVAVFMAFLAGFVGPTIVGAAGRRRQAIARTEAIAAWAEQLRDVITASAGLQEAIRLTADVAPVEIRDDVMQLANGLSYDDLPNLLREFASRLEDPAADQIVVSLILASTRSTGNLAELLSQAAAAARAEATMRMRTEVSRAQTFTDARAATLIVLGMFGYLVVFNPEYLEPYDSVVGQLVLGLVGMLWALAISGLASLARVRRPVRVLALSGGAQ